MRAESDHKRYLYTKKGDKMAVIDAPTRTLPRRIPQIGAVRGEMLQRAVLDPDEYPHQEALIDFIHTTAQREGKTETYELGKKVFDLVWRVEKTREGIEYVTNSVSSPHALPFESSVRPRVVSILQVLNADEFGLEELAGKNIGERHACPPDGIGINLKLVHPIGTIAYAETMLPLALEGLRLSEASANSLSSN